MQRHVVWWGCPGGSAVTYLPAMQETQEMRIQSLGWKDPLEEGTATHSSIIAWEICGLRSLVDYSPKGCRVRYD